MFRAQVLRRGFSLWTSRVPRSQIIRSAARDGHDTVHIQRVRFRRPFISRSRAVGIAFALSGTYAFLRWLDEDLEDEEEGEEGKEEEEESKEIHLAPRVSGRDGTPEADGKENQKVFIFFFPTGFSRPKERTYYKGTDPEWREFCRLARDKPQLMAIKQECVQKIRNDLASRKLFVGKLGKVSVDKGGHWLNIRFPYGPPLEYERPGIAMTTDLTFHRGTKDVTPVNHKRFETHLLPTAVASSLYVHAKIKAKENWDAFRASIGWEDKSIQKKANLVGILTPPPLPSSGSSPAPVSTGSSGSSSVTQQPGTGAFQRQSTTQTSPSTSEKGEPSSSTVMGAIERFLSPLWTKSDLKSPKDLVIDLSPFLRALGQKRRPARYEMPRGCVAVVGLVEIIGEHRTATLEVVAAYNTKTQKFDAIDVGMREVVENNQLPRG